MMRAWARASLAERVQIIGSISGLAFSASTMIFLYIQARDTHTLAQQAVTQSAAAREQAMVAEQTFQLAFRPNIEVAVPKYTQTTPQDEVSITFRNNGSGSARNVVARLSITESGEASNDSANVSIAEMPVGASRNSVLYISQSLKNSILLPMVGKVTVLKAFARISYDGAPAGRTQVCQAFTYDPMARVFNPTTPCEY